MILTFGRISLKNKGVTIVEMNCVISEAIAAPISPKKGISKKFSKTFAIAEKMYIYFKNFCFPLQTIQEFLATFKYEKTTHQDSIESDAAANKKSSPYIKPINGFEKKVKNIAALKAI